MRRNVPLTRRTPLRAKPKATKRRPISAASKEQRSKVSDRVSIISAEGPCDPRAPCHERRVAVTAPTA
jgi:hypothetical protein